MERYSLTEQLKARLYDMFLNSDEIIEISDNVILDTIVEIEYIHPEFEPFSATEIRIAYRNASNNAVDSFLANLEDSKGDSVAEWGIENWEANKIKYEAMRPQNVRLRELKIKLS